MCLCKHLGNSVQSHTVILYRGGQQTESGHGYSQLVHRLSCRILEALQSEISVWVCSVHLFADVIVDDSVASDYDGSLRRIRAACSEKFVRQSY